MITLRQKAFTATAVVSLVAWSATAGVWVRSYWVENRVLRAHTETVDGVWLDRQDSLTLRRGKVYAGTSSRRVELSRPGMRSRRPSGPGAPAMTYWRWDEVSPPPKWGYRGRWGFAYRSTEQSSNTRLGPSTYRNTLLMFPWGLTMAVLGVLPVWWLVALRRHLKESKRRRTGLCVQCGYDLRASPERCPECGAPAEGQSSQGPRKPAESAAAIRSLETSGTTPRTSTRSVESRSAAEPPIQPEARRAA